MPALEEFSHLVGLLDDAQRGNAAWGDAITALAAFLGASTAAVGRYDAAPGVTRIDSTPIDPDFERLYATRWLDSNPLQSATRRLPETAMFSFASTREAAGAIGRVLFEEWFRPQHLDHALGCNIACGPSHYSFVTCYRPDKRGDFGSEARRRLAVVVPHLRRTLAETTAGEIDLSTLTRRFGLTAAEGRIALLLAGGFTLADTADRLGVTRATARTHLAHLFSKMQISRQAELILLLRAGRGPVHSRRPNTGKP